MKLKLLLGTLMFTAFTANAQVATINEQFESFNIGRFAAWPQNNWSNIQYLSTGPWVYADGSTNKFIYYYSFFSSNVAGYLISPQIVAPNGTKTLSFNAFTNGGPSTTEVATIQIGMVDGTTEADMASFVPVGNLITLTSANTAYSVNIPTSSKQLIAFKMTGAASHVAISVDNVVYDGSSLAVNDISKSNNDFKFAVNSSNTSLEFVTKKEPKKIEIYSASGQKAAEGKLKGQTFDISGLQTGVYYMLVETAEGSTVKSKFIKK